MSADDIASRLLSYRELREIYQQESKPLPYVIERQRPDEVIMFIGARHTNDPGDHQYPVLSQRWTEFLKEANKNNAIVLTEGGVRLAMQTEEAAIRKYGEAGLLALWASKANIPLSSPEPPKYSEANELRRTFPEHAIIYYYFARQIPQWHRAKARPDFTLYIQETLDHYQQALGWDFNFSLENLIAVHEKLFGKPFCPDDSDFFKLQSNPLYDETIVQQVAQACTTARDVERAQEIIRYWDEGKSIFSVYGSAHAYRLEPMIMGLPTLR